MTSKKSRALGGALLAAACALGPLPAQRGQVPDAFARGRLFSLPRSQDDIFAWRQAQEDIAAGRFADAVERLHYLLQFGQGGVVPTNDAGDLFLGLRSAVITTLRNLPEEGAAAYEKLTQREAGRLLRTAFTGVQPAELESLATGFPTSSAGVRARVRLADLALEEGRAYDAEMHCRSALDCVRDDDPQRAAIARRMLAAEVILGAAPTDDRAAQALTADLRPALPLGRAVPTDAFGAYGRGLDTAGHMVAPQGNLRLQYRITDVRARGFRDRLFPMHAVGDRDGIIINDGMSLDCFDPLSGAELWRAPGPLVDEPEADFDDPETAINRDMVLAAACTADVVVGALQVRQVGQTERFRHIDVIHRIPRRRLFAVDRASGKRIWSHWDRVDGPITTAFEGHDAAGPPLILGDTVYVASHDQTGAIAYYLTAYDLATGATRWRSLVCSSQGEVNMFGNSRREYAASPLIAQGGVIYGATNMGVCFAADAASGRIRWVSPYDVIPLPETRLTDQQDRIVYFANNPLMICDGVLACTPLDSDSALAFDIDTGARLWTLPFRLQQRPRQEIYWLLGALDGEFIFAGTGIVAMPARPTGATKSKPRIVRTEDSLRRAGEDLPAQLMPRGALADDAIFFSSTSGLRVIGVNGEERDSRLVATEVPLGNLLLVDGILVSVRDGALDFFFDEQRLMTNAEERVRAHPDDPAALLELAALLRGTTGTFNESRAERAESCYRKGLELARRAGLGAQSPVYRRLSNDLFRMRFEHAARLQTRNKGEALKILRTARDDAPLPEQWLEAERAVLELVRGDTPSYLAELALMSQRHGEVVTRFPGVGRVPVAAYALWQSALNETDPARAAQSCQELLERFGDVRLGERAARDIARDTQLQIITAHGADAYAEIEARARAALEAATGEVELLRQVIARYPPSEAAKNAVAAMLDLAVERGDLAAATNSYAQAIQQGRVGAGVHRRLMVAAQKSGNTALAGALARRLLATSADQPSDFPPDGGKLLRDVVAAPDVAAAVPELPTEHPDAIVATKTRSNGAAIGPRLREVFIAPGFPAPPRRLVFLAVNGDRLEAIDPALGAKMFESPVLADIPFADGEGEQIVCCGSVVVLCEPTRVRGIDAATGAEKWSLTAEAGRRLQSLGTQDGVLHLFSDLESASDGGYLLGIEPISGAPLFQVVFPADAPSICPTSSARALWEFQPGRGDAEPVIVRLDPLDGRVDLRISLGSSLLQRLGLDDSDRRAFRTSMLQRNLFADDRTVYLPVVAPDRSIARGIAALDFNGRERWLWRAMQDRELVMAALHGDRVVILEQSGRGGRLVLLDSATGTVRREVVCGTDASVNWSRGYRSADAPDVLMLVDRSVATNSSSRGGQLKITCFSLDSSVGSFGYPLPGQYEQIAGQPVQGRDFVAFAATRDDELTIFALDPQTQRSILSGGRAKLRLQLSPPFLMQAVGAYVALQSGEGISILGPQASPR